VIYSTPAGRRVRNRHLLSLRTSVNRAVEWCGVFTLMTTLLFVLREVELCIVRQSKMFVDWKKFNRMVEWCGMLIMTTELFLVLHIVELCIVQQSVWLVFTLRYLLLSGITFIP